MSGFVRKHVVCAISGGVDSAVAAYLVKQAGHVVTGCFMQNWSRQDELFENCDSERDRADAEYVCSRLRIPLVCVDFSKSYWNNVFRLTRSTTFIRLKIK